MYKDFRLALCQMLVGMNKEANLAKAQDMISKAVHAGSKLVVLPECFNSPYGTKYFAEYAEDITDPRSQTIPMLKDLALKNSIYLVGGSIPEKQGDKYYNTSVILNPKGEVIGVHRKVHLFDMNVPGKITFFESEVLSPGNQATIVSTDFCKIGMGICYDIRFPEYAWTLSKDESVGILIYPGCFNMTTGPKHWELLMRARAVDNLIFVAACSQASDPKASYVSWGHSLVSNPLGEVESLDEKEGLLIKDIRFEELINSRNSIWNRKHKRFDIYRQ